MGIVRLRLTVCLVVCCLLLLLKEHRLIKSSVGNLGLVFTEVHPEHFGQNFLAVLAYVVVVLVDVDLLNVRVQS